MADEQPKATDQQSSQTSQSENTSNQKTDQNPDPSKVDKSGSGQNDPTPAMTENPEPGKPDNTGGLPDPKADGYDPGIDPAVPSSVVAENVRRELENGDSPTLDALHKTWHEQNDEKSDSDDSDGKND